MTPHQAKLMLDKIVGQIFGYQNPLTVEQFQQKYAFDVRLPNQVSDSTTGQLTWAQSVNPSKFMTMENAWKRQEIDDWLLPKRPLNSIEDILSAWNEVNYTATERQINSQNVTGSDNVYNSENVYRSQDIRRSKNIIFSDGVEDSEYIAAGQRSNTFVVSLLVTLGASTWVYTKLQRYSGNNTKQSVMGAAAVGFFVFIVLIYVAEKLINGR
jgi:hypothetical protein